MAARGKPDRAGGSVDLSGYWGLFLVLTFFLPSAAFSQTTSEKENQFVKLVGLGENGPAMALLDDLLEEDSTGIYRLAGSVEQLILPGNSNRGEPSSDEILKLFQVYDLGIRHDPAGPQSWHTRQALLALRYPSVFGKQTGYLLRNAVVAAPQDCPLMLYEKWAEWEISDWRAENRNPKAPGRAMASLKRFAKLWRQVSELLYLRQIANSSEAEDAGRLQQRLALRIRDVLPDCADLGQVFASPPPASDCAHFLIAHELQQCDLDPGQWNSAFTCATAESPAAWMYRTAAARSFNERDYEKALEHQSRAESIEIHPLLRASDLLRQAEILALLKKFSEARTHIRKAMEVYPNWGEPYFRLCDLYLLAAPDCNFSAFDRKAIFWLAIDLCRTAQNADPGCEPEAARRIYRYKQSSPSPSEIAFKGLKEGDTWPLRCWMNTVTTVKVD